MAKYYKVKSLKKTHNNFESSFTAIIEFLHYLYLHLNIS